MDFYFYSYNFYIYTFGFIINLFYSRKENPGTKSSNSSNTTRTKTPLVIIGSPNESNPNTIAYSLDNGNTWIGLGTQYFSDYGSDVFSYNGRWVAVGKGGNSVIYSDDGINWTPSESGNSILSEGVSVSHNGEIWMAIGQGINKIAISNDGINWEGLNSLDEFISPESLYTKLYSNNQRFFMTNINPNNTSYNTIILYSDDNGLIWDASSIVNDIKNNRVYCNDLKCISSGSGISYSTISSNDNGDNWTGLNVFSLGDGETFALYQNNGIWMLANKDKKFKISYDNGVTWSSEYTSLINIQGFYYSNNKWYMYGQGNIYESEDLISWNPVNTSDKISSIFSMV